TPSHHPSRAAGVPRAPPLETTLTLREVLLPLSNGGRVPAGSRARPTGRPYLPDRRRAGERRGALSAGWRARHGRAGREAGSSGCRDGRPPADADPRSTSSAATAP